MLKNKTITLILSFALMLLGLCSLSYAAMAFDLLMFFFGILNILLAMTCAHLYIEE